MDCKKEELQAVFVGCSIGTHMRTLVHDRVHTAVLQIVYPRPMLTEDPADHDFSANSLNMTAIYCTRAYTC